MKHLDDIAALVRTLQESTTFHALVIESPPGWAKSTTIDRVLAELGIPFGSVGSYSTPLSLYNALASATLPTLVIDDCAGILDDPSALSVLKAATWASSGSNGQRRVSWRSSSERVMVPEFLFHGKLILLTNGLRRDRETEALLSRTLYYRVSFGIEKVAEMLREAAKSQDHYGDLLLAREVCEFLVAHLSGCDYNRVNLRTLQMAFDVARSNPETWRGLVPQLLPKITLSDLVSDLSRRGITIEEQAKEFMGATGMTRRSFFNHRRRLGLRKHAPHDVAGLESESFTGAEEAPRCGELEHTLLSERTTA